MLLKTAVDLIQTQRERERQNIEREGSQNTERGQSEHRQRAVRTQTEGSQNTERG